LSKAAAVGHVTPKGQIIANGKMHRFKCDPKDAKRSCSFVAHADGVPNIALYDWRKGGDKPVFTANGPMPDGVDMAQLAEEAKANKAKHEAEEAAKHASAAKAAQSLWSNAKPASPDHQYLKAKGIKPHIARQICGMLLLPVMQGEEIAGYQQIWPDGQRQFGAGTPASGGYCIIGDLPETGGPVLMSESFSTGATLHEVTGYPVIVAFFADNLLPVAKQFEMAPFDVVICSDDDWRAAGNPGLTKAREAAFTTGAKLAVPDFSRFKRGEKDTDFNDLHRLDKATCNALDGAWEVYWCIERAKCVEHTPGEESGQGEEAKEEPDHFRPVQLGNLLKRPAPKRRWLIENWIPAGQATVFAGEGGIGKSLAALQLAATVATGTDWLGMPVGKPKRVAVLSAEDDIDEMHFRFECIARDLPGEREATLQALNDVWLIDASKDLDPTLATFDEKGKGVPVTPTFEKLKAFVDENKIDVLILDSAADVFTEEINRYAVRTFARLIRKLADTVILLAHPSVSAMKDGRGVSGSTHWINAFRSLIKFERATDHGGNEPDPDLRFLTVGKANRARAKQKIAVRWTENGFVRDEKAASGLDELSRRLKAEEVFIDILRKINGQGRRVSPNRSPSYAPAVFAEHPDCDGCTKKDFAHAMENLLTAGKIEAVPEGPESRKYQRLKVVENWQEPDDEIIGFDPAEDEGGGDAF
jgi:phage/plasmid primase-like uncharacterized protein/RecA-family ATPase